MSSQRLNMHASQLFLDYKRRLFIIFKILFTARHPNYVAILGKKKKKTCLHASLCCRCQSVFSSHLGQFWINIKDTVSSSSIERRVLIRTRYR